MINIFLGGFLSFIEKIWSFLSTPVFGVSIAGLATIALFIELLIDAFNTKDD